MISVPHMVLIFLLVLNGSGWTSAKTTVDGLRSTGSPAPDLQTTEPNQTASPHKHHTYPQHGNKSITGFRTAVNESSRAKMEEEYQFAPVLRNFGPEERSRSLHLVGVMLILTLCMIALIIHSAVSIPKPLPPIHSSV